LVGLSLSTSADLHSFRLAHPAVRTSSRADVTAAAFLSVLALALWTVVLPIEVLFHVTH
jgi:hypothetical protein